MISFETSKSEADIICQIADRANLLSKKYDIEYKYMTAMMDITACHANGNELRLDELLKADDSNFAHDVFGIRRHINRETGKLENCFLPRYSK